MTWKLGSKVDNRKEAVRIGKMAVTWCMNNMGVNRRKKYAPNVIFYKALPTDTCMGEYRYWDNELIVYWNNVDNVKHLIQTIIHEWQHQLQPMNNYDKLAKEYGYENHPLEIDATNAEAIHYKPMWMEIKPKLNR